MGKSLLGGGVDFPIRASTDQLRSDLEQGKSMVKQAASEMRATANVSIAGSADLGPAGASAAFEGNVQAKMRNLQRGTERERIATAARNRMGMMLPNESREMARFMADQEMSRRKAASEAAIGLSGSRYGPSMDDIAAAGRDPSAARTLRATQMANFARSARFGAGIAGGALAAAGFIDNASLVQRRAFRDAGERFQFQDRSIYNDSTMRAAAGGVASGENPMTRLLSIVPRFADELERASHSAAILADSHRAAVMAIQDANIRRAGATGQPFEAFRMGQGQELSDARGRLDIARRNAWDVQQSGSRQSRQVLEAVTLWDDLKSDRERRTRAAMGTSREAQTAYDRLEEVQRLEGRRFSAGLNADRFSAHEGARAEQFRGAGALASLRNDSIGSFAAQRRSEQLQMDSGFNARMAAATGNDYMRDQIQKQWDQARVNFKLESKLQLRSMAADNTGTFMSASEGARFAKSNQMQQSMENANLDTALNETLRQLSEVMSNLAGALSRTPLLGQPN